MMNGSLHVRPVKRYITKNAGNPTMNSVPFTAAGHAMVLPWVVHGVMKFIYMMTVLFA